MSSSVSLSKTQKIKVNKIVRELSNYPGLVEVYRAISELTNPGYAIQVIKSHISKNIYSFNSNSMKVRRIEYAFQFVRSLPESFGKAVLQKLKQNRLGISGKNCGCCDNCSCGQHNNAYPPAMDYRDNYYIPPYEIPVEPNYFPGYNIVSMTPRNNYYAPPTWAMAN